MDRLQTAKAALEAELAQVRADAEQYLARITQLEEALASLGAISMPVTKRGQAPAKSSPPSASTATKKQAATGTKRGPRRTQKEVGELPFTGGDFWVNLINDQPKTARGVLQAAIGALGINPSKDQTKKLSNRMIFALRALLKAKKIRDSGAGRSRTYFK